MSKDGNTVRDYKTGYEEFAVLHVQKDVGANVPVDVEFKSLAIGMVMEGTATATF